MPNGYSDHVDHNNDDRMKPPEKKYLRIDLNDRIETTIANDPLLDADGKTTMIMTRRGLIEESV